MGQYDRQKGSNRVESLAWRFFLYSVFGAHHHWSDFHFAPTSVGAIQDRYIKQEPFGLPVHQHLARGRADETRRNALTAL